MAQFNFKAIGTSWVIDIYEDINASGSNILLNKQQQDEILAKIMARIDAFDKAYSRFRPDSIVSRIAKSSVGKVDDYEFPADAKLLFETYYDLYKKTSGYFTPLVGQILVDAGYDADYSLIQKKELSWPPRLEDVMEFEVTSHDVLNDADSRCVLHIKKTVQLDFGAAGKGYLIDLVAKVLEENNYFNYCIDAGGDILHKDKKTIRVGLEDPENADQVIGVYELRNGSICGSAGNRRCWGNFTHIVNPKTLASPTEIIAVWVMADSALVADALTTCLFFVPANTLTDKYKFEYFILYKDRSFDKSANFKGEVFV